jgi:DNA-binding beta-propeller fold protein YncE
MSTKKTIKGSAPSEISLIARTVAAAAVAGLVIILNGCASAPPEKEVRLVWPEPPEKARIEFVRSIVSDEDLNKDTTGTQSLLKFLEGEKPAKNRIVEPMGIAISDDTDRLYISDHAQSAVFVYDLAKKTAFKIGGEESPLASPVGIALDAKENIYVVEQAKKGISVFDRQGKSLRFITDASIVRPTGIAIDKQRGKIYVADTSHSKNEDHTVKVFDLEARWARVREI